MVRNFLLSFLVLFSSCNHQPQVWASTTASRQYNFVDDKNNAIPITASRMDAEFDNVITKLNQKVIITSSAPSAPIAGLLWYDSTNKFLKQYRNSEWVELGAVQYGTVMATPQSGDFWLDNSGSEVVVKVRNKANDAWLTLLQSSGFSTGMIMMWSGTIATIPSGWVLCDGTNSTPDLRDKFVIGAKQDSSGIAKTNVTGSLTQTGGAATHTNSLAELVPHTHQTTSGQAGGGSGTGSQMWSSGSTAGDLSGSTGSGTAWSILNPYYALAFIMKS